VVVKDGCSISYGEQAENDPLGDQQKLEELENKILEAYEVWEELEELSKTG
jgi:hypothetical protein